MDGLFWTSRRHWWERVNNSDRTAPCPQITLEQQRINVDRLIQCWFYVFSTVSAGWVTFLWQVDRAGYGPGLPAWQTEMLTTVLFSHPRKVRSLFSVWPYVWHIAVVHLNKVSYIISSIPKEKTPDTLSILTWTYASTAYSGFKV